MGVLCKSKKFICVNIAQYMITLKSGVVAGFNSKTCFNQLVINNRIAGHQAN